MKRILLLAFLVVCGWMLFSTAARPAFSAAQQVDFERDIRPLLHARCVQCHGPIKQQSGLRLDNKAAALKGGISGLAILPGKSGDSELIRRVSSNDKAETMPPTGDRLSAREITLLKAWIDAGAHWPESPATAPARGFNIDQRRAEHWCWQPVRAVLLPAGAASHPIDRFLPLAAEPADRRTLLRRVTFDLTGLPPAPEEIAAFEKDGDYARGVVFHDGKKNPEEELVTARLLVESAPEAFSRDAMKQRLQELLTAAINAWERNQLTDEQAVFLDYFVRQGLLPNTAEAIPLIAEYRKLESEIAIPRRAPGVLEEAPPDHPLLVRGDHKRLGDPVARGFLTSLGGPRYSDPRTARLRLAEEIASPKNPLTARVMVNRLWQYAFRTGLVPTPDNFGMLGEKTAQPELLDWLANRFIADGWSIKKMLRLLVTSQAYQSSALPVRRLEAEEIRDAILAVSGQLDLTMYGEPVPVFYAHDTGATKGDRPKGPMDGRRRRSVYLEVRRNATNPFLEVFDVYKPTSTRGKRDVTNVPAQSLTLMNSPFVMEQATKWAATKPAINELYLRALGRSATVTEQARAREYLTELRGLMDEQQATANLADALFNLKEFVYVR
jgi:mono/diheme cytochrome c family protein